MIVTITPTVMDGTVLRWYDTDDPERVTGRRPVMSVSRNRLEHGEEPVAGEHLAAAMEAYAELKANRVADVRRYATHMRLVPGRPLIPLKAGL